MLEKSILNNICALEERAKAADMGLWQVDESEWLVLLPSKNSVMAKTEQEWENNLRYVAMLEPDTIKSIAEHILSQPEVHKEIVLIASEAIELANGVSPGPWSLNESNGTIISGDEVSILSWNDFNEQNNARYIAHCRPQNVLAMIYWIKKNK